MATPHDPLSDDEIDADKTSGDPGALSNNEPQYRLAIAISSGLLAVAYVSRYIQIGGCLGFVLMAPIVGPFFFVFALVAPETATNLLDRWDQV